MIKTWLNAQHLPKTTPEYLLLLAAPAAVHSMPIGVQPDVTHVSLYASMIDIFDKLISLWKL